MNKKGVKRNAAVVVMTTEEQTNELSIFSYHGTGAVSLSSTVLW